MFETTNQLIANSLPNSVLNMFTLVQLCIKFAQAQKDVLKTQYMCNNYLTCEHDEGKESNIERGRESVWLNRFGPS